MMKSMVAGYNKSKLPLLCLIAMISFGSGISFWPGAQLQAAEALSTEPVTAALSVMPEDVECVTVQGRDEIAYDMITFEDCDFIQPPGWPMIPSKMISLALPNGFDVTGVETTVTGRRVLEGSFKLHPVQVPMTLSQSEPDVFTAPDVAVYALDENLPGREAELVGQGSLSGYALADIVTFPVQWNPQSGKVTLLDIEVTLRLTPSNSPSPVHVRTAQGEKLFRDAVKNMVINPAQVPEKACERIVTGTQARMDTVEYLIITDPEYVTYFQVLADWKMKRGLLTEVVATDWVYANYGGAPDDDPTRIRECIKDYWQNKGLLYVLLGGDSAASQTPKIPDRRAFAQSDAGGDKIPCDLYYADLDGDWDGDGDGTYGEYPADGIDMYADVYVGRASVGTTSEAELFVTKVLQYEGESTQTPIDPAHAHKMLFLGSVLGAGAKGKTLKDLIDTESVPAQFDPITKMYETDGTITPLLAKDEISVGYNIINHCGHGNYDSIQCGAGYMQNSAIAAVTNAPNYSIMYSLSCLSCNFVKNDCFAEKFLNAANGGGFYIGNTRNGLYSLPFTDHLSPRLDRKFFEVLFDAAYGYYPLGKVHQEAKHLRVNAAKNNSAERQVQYEITLLGDPTTPVWKNTPQQLYVMHYKALDMSGGDLEVSVKSGGAGVEDATVCLWKEDEVYLVDTTNAAGNVTFTPAPATTGSMFVTVTKDDYLPYEGAVTFLNSILAADGSSISAAAGGVINFTLTAGAEYGNRKYFMLGTSSGTTPGTGLPGGYATLPLNWDLVTDLILSLANSPVFLNFAGTLDATGLATAQFNTYGPLPGSYIGLNLHFAFTFYNPFDMASNAVQVDIVP